MQRPDGLVYRPELLGEAEERALLELPFEHVIVSHGEPVHDRAAYERALELPAWG